MIFNRPNPAPGATPPAAKPQKRSILGLLFNPQLGPALSPLRESTAIFLQLLAMVFSIYGLFPKTHPALKDIKARLTLREIITEAWSRISFTREGAPRTIIFFAVIGMMAVSAFAVISTILSLFVGHAHAQTTGMSVFQPEDKDVAQAWLDYLFNNPSSSAFPVLTDTYDTATASMEDPFAGSVSLQTALASALALYSDAILIVAAIILFYHLASMVVETAHHGTPMGKRASQIWAPIRLVVAIGLLVPISGGLNCGQFIVIKMAELGSGMASHVWDEFLDTIASYKTQMAPGGSTSGARVALDIIRMEACREAWNAEITAASHDNIDMSASVIQGAKPTAYVLGNIKGTKYTYSSDTIGDSAVCGAYFIPSGNGSDLALAAAAAQYSAITKTLPDFNAAAQKITSFMSPSTSSASTPLKLDNKARAAIDKYQATVTDELGNLIKSNKQEQAMSTAINTIKPYGWVMAGTFLNTIDRLQATVAGAIVDSAPKTWPPVLRADSVKEPPPSMWDWLFGGSKNDAWNIHKKVADDMTAFDVYTNQSFENYDASGGTNDIQCAAMVGLDGDSSSHGMGLSEWVFARIDWLASLNGVWDSGSASKCSSQANNTAKTNNFSLGVKIGGRDPFAQMAKLGHANLDMAFGLAEYGVAASVAGGAAETIGSALGPIGQLVGKVVGGAGSGAASILMFFALIFWVCGFALAYLVPMLPFMQFFFAVISWIAAVIEAVVAIPLVALAHLNPEGEGLSGQQARASYFFIFNLFLRPALVVFGLICGLIVFLIALSFLNYGYSIAAAGAGGTAYGHAAMSRIIYSIMYVAVVIICANHSFQLITHIPNQAMSWLGGQAQSMPNMGDASKFEGMATAVSGYVGQQGLSQLGNASKAAGGFIGAGAGGLMGLPKARAKHARDKTELADKLKAERDDKNASARLGSLNSSSGQTGSTLTAGSTTSSTTDGSKKTSEDHAKNMGGGMSQASGINPQGHTTIVAGAENHEVADAHKRLDDVEAKQDEIGRRVSGLEGTGSATDSGVS